MKKKSARRASGKSPRGGSDELYGKVEKRIERARRITHQLLGFAARSNSLFAELYIEITVASAMPGLRLTDTVEKATAAYNGEECLKFLKKRLLMW